MSNSILKHVPDALMYGFATYGGVNFVSHYVPLTGGITEPPIVFAWVILFFLSRIILNGLFPRQK